ncbi:DNA cytosine methyltransferase [Brevibacillus brevis]|uniref:DNA (cytosine-5-)-methyltransferase n=1 Tax=Brevibacillus brevis TaxID=1393 RepID=A0ABY9TCU5_BREBE|nr:DNA cytosine methyltransferase [Brevibacillus brevis]WNC17934.1 DNA cytosine methyltransferase [Brevibacillus brevis]
MLLKKRVGKNSSRGIYLQDKELKETVFQPGRHYKYVIDAKNRKIIILSSDDQNDNVVSKRRTKEDLKPVIDIRHKKALSVFKGVDYLQVEIFEDRIVVEGYVEEKQSFFSSVASGIKKAFRGKATVSHITDFLRIKKTASIVLSRDQLKEAVGDHVSYEQISLFDFLPEATVSRPSRLYSIQKKLNQLAIPLQVASLFSGAGIMDVGFQQAGFDLVFALEHDEDAVQTYRYNLGGHVVQADIKTFDKSRITKAPVMIGGSPCQGFSNSNRYTNYLDNPNNKLVREFIDAVKTNENAQVFVLENVPEILTAGGGQFKEEILEALSDFEITHDVMNAADYGSAQLRERAIFIGSKIGKIDIPKPYYKLSQYKTVREAFAGLNDRVPNQLDVSDAKDITLERMKHVKPGGNVKDIPVGLRPKGQHSNMYKRLEWDKPSITLVNPRKSMILHPEEQRIISVREGARLMGLDDSFVFLGKKASKQQQIANGVPVEMAFAIAEVIKNAILSFNIRHRNLCHSF